MFVSSLVQHQCILYSAKWFEKKKKKFKWLEEKKIECSVLKKCDVFYFPFENRNEMKYLNHFSFA